MMDYRTCVYYNLSLMTIIYCIATVILGSWLHTDQGHVEFGVPLQVALSCIQEIGVKSMKSPFLKKKNKKQKTTKKTPRNVKLKETQVVN